MSNIFNDSMFSQDRREKKERRSKEKESANVFYRRYIVARIYVVMAMISTIIISIFEPESMYYTQLLNNGYEGIFVLCVFSFFTFLCVIDLVINDFMPNKYKFMILYDNRHIIYMAIALCAYGLSAAVILTDHSSIVLIRVWLDGFIAATVAVLDIFARHGKGIAWESGK